VNKFQVIIQKQPAKYYQKVPSNVAKLLEKAFRQLEENPFYLPGKIKRLKGMEGKWRYNTDGIRIVYEINVADKKVGVLAILPRGDVYKKL